MSFDGITKCPISFLHFLDTICCSIVLYVSSFELLFIITGCGEKENMYDGDFCVTNCFYSSNALQFGRILLSLPLQPKILLCLI